MKKFLTLTLAVGLASVALTAQAQIYDFTGSVQTDTITTSGDYTFTVAGADGGAGFEDFGGNGALLVGTTYLTAGTTLDILVGGVGNPVSVGAGNGGGGTFIYTSSSSPLIIAGGGGGAADESENGGEGLASSTSGQDGLESGGAGGTSGSGGSGGSSLQSGGGGAGFLSNGGEGFGGLADDDGSGLGGQTGPTFAGGEGYSNEGGFGGGGGGGFLGGGGGGGYSGGGGGTGLGDPGAGAGGGGGSYIAPSFFDVSTTDGGNTTSGNGYVEISSAPEPSTWSLLLCGFGVLLFWRSRKTTEKE